VEQHSGALTILVLCALVLGTLLILVPQLLRSHQRALEMQHAERMRTLENGEVPAPLEDPSRAAGRLALLVPMVVICAAATVTCFLVAYASEHLFAVVLAVWSVAGVVSLAAVTGGVALTGRLAQLNSNDEDEGEVPGTSDEGAVVRDEGPGP
jgi:hypothetical protein